MIEKTWIVICEAPEYLCYGQCGQCAQSLKSTVYLERTGTERTNNLYPVEILNINLACLWVSAFQLEQPALRILFLIFNKRQREEISTTNITQV